jgi:predicted transcriptional regulator
VNKMSMDMNSLVEMAKNRSVENEKRRKTNYKDNVELRRHTVQSMLIRGNTQWEIAEYLGVSQPTVSRDIQWLRSVAKKELKDKLEKKVPEEYYRYLVSIDEVLRNTWEIALSAFDEKIRLGALQFVIDCSKHKMDVIMNPPILKSNNTVKPFKRKRHSEADNTRDSDDSFTRNQKEIKKNQLEKQMF